MILFTNPWQGGLLVGHLTGMSPLVHELESAMDWLSSAGSGTAEWMTASICSVATGFPFAGPFERRGIGVPGVSCSFQPADEFGRIGRRLTGQRAVGEDPLDGLGHVQPRPAERRVQRHHAMFEQPHDEAWGECPLRLSMTNRRRSGGSVSHNVGLTVRPACQCSHAARLSVSSRTLAGGNAARIAVSSASNQACRTTFGQLVTPLTRTCPVDGWKSVISLAVPWRMCSCG